MALLVTPVVAEVYSFRDEFGVIHLTDRPTDPRYKLVMRVGKNGHLRSVSHTDPLQRRRYLKLIGDTAKRYQLDEALLRAVVEVESGFDPGAVSKKGAVGLMQLMPGTASRYGVHNRHDPAANLDGGARYLRDLLQRFDSVPLALAAYNAGENAVEKYGKRIPPFPETRNYVDKVMSAYRDQRHFRY
jgi:soluble lytic murein transglycosylase-like protein